MMKIENLEQYTDFLNKYQKEFPDIIYNHMMLPGEAASHIERGRFYCEEQETGIVFLVREKDFYKLYFYVPERAEIHVPETDRPRLLEYISAEGREDPQVEKMRKKTEALGFRPYVRNKRHRALIRDEYLIPLDTGYLREDLLWKYASEKDAASIYRLWTVMDIYNSTIPEEREFAAMIAAKELLTVWKEGRMCGVVRIKQENRRTGSMWLMAVDQEYRRQGIATELYKLSMSVLKSRGYSQVIEWCDETNQAILSVSGRFGFQPDGTVSETYILK